MGSSNNFFRAGATAGRPPAARRQASLAIGLALLVAGCSRPPVPPPIQLLDAAAGAEVSWPDLAGAPAPKVDPLEGPAFPAPGQRMRLELEGSDLVRDTRAAILAPTGSRYRFRLELPPQPRLRVGLGAVPPPEGVEQTLRFTARILGGKRKARVVLDETVVVTAASGWRQVDLPIQGRGGQKVTLELAVDAPAGAPLAWGAWAVPEVLSSKDSPPALNLVLISLDTLRADHLGCYGYSRPTSPSIDRFAQKSVQFMTAISQSPWTRPSHRAMLTGLFPVSTGGLQSPAIAELLRAAGYRTTALTGGGQVDHRFGFSAGFEVFRVADWMRSKDDLDAWIRTSAGRKSFLFLHSYETHDPYDHEDFVAGIDRGRVRSSFSKRDWSRFRNRLTEGERKAIEALYDGDIAFADRQVGAFLEALERSGQLDRTIVMLTSDHGEQFWEHGSWRHGQNMYDHQLHVPLLVYLPPALRRDLARASGKEVPARVTDVTRLVDLYPTILDLLGVELKHKVQGRSLRALLDGTGLPPVDAFAENTNVGDEKKALRSQKFKFVLTIPRHPGPDSPGDRYELFDLVADPREQSDIAPERADLVTLLSQRIDSIRHGQLAAAPDDELPSNVSPELREQLEALGYVGD